MVVSLRAGVGTGGDVEGGAFGVEDVNAGAGVFFEVDVGWVRGGAGDG